MTMRREQMVVTKFEFAQVQPNGEDIVTIIQGDDHTLEKLKQYRWELLQIKCDGVLKLTSGKGWHLPRKRKAANSTLASSVKAAVVGLLEQVL